jgi:hypothetical protein
MPGAAQTIPGQPRRHEIGVRANVAAAIGLGPGLAPGVGIGAALRGQALSIDLEGRLIGESSTTAATGSATASLWTASLAPCLHGGRLAACVVGSAGVLRARGDGFATTTSADAPYLAVAARGVLEIPIGDRLRLRWTAEIAAPLVTIHLTVDGRDAWTSPRVSALTSVGLGVTFH